MSAKLTLGPCLFNWNPDQWRDFYFRIADEAPIDAVYIGEAVCSKRAPFFESVLADVVDRLQAAGKQVVLSTLALIMTEREMRSVRDLAGQDDILVEANDVSAAALLKGKPHVIGPFVNVYNEGTLAYLARQGAVRVCLPVELPGKAIEALALSRGTEGGAALEVFAFGRLPLAVSARCYHARTYNLAKDNCQYVCEKDPDGMDLDTVDGEPFLAVNGIQTMSYTYANLVGELDRLRRIGVSHFRLSPHTCDMVEAARIFRAVLDGTMEVADADERLEDLLEGMPFSNGYFYGEKGVRFTESDLEPAE